MMEDDSPKENEKNQKVVALGIAELGMSLVLCIFGGIFTLLGAFRVNILFVLNPIPLVGFFVSLPWIFVSWKLIQSAEKTRDIRQRRRFVLYWTCYALIVGLFNLGAIILFVVVLVLKNYYHGNGTLIAGIIIASIIILARGFILVTVFLFSRDLLKESESKPAETENPFIPPPAALKVEPEFATEEEEAQPTNENNSPIQTTTVTTF